MELIKSFVVKQTKQSKISEVDFDNLEFGKYVSDHMLVADYNRNEVSPGNTLDGWQQAQIVPFSNLSLSPTALALHYGQTVFEGLKAFRMKDGRINIFRLDKHYDRFVKSLNRLCMAVPPTEIFIDGLMKLVEIDEAWVPAKNGSALYLRPFMFASEAKFGIKISDEYRFIIFSGPVPELYARPIRVKIETTYARAAKGGTGFAKCGGNYGAAFYPTRQARELGYDQVLWTDARENKFIEESGMMNVMFVIDDVLVTPPLSDSILDGVTRDSLLVLAKDMGYLVEERPVAVAELREAFLQRRVTEAFGAGTAAVVAPIETVNIGGEDFQLPAYTPDSVLHKLKHQLERIRTGVDADVHGWNFIL